MLHLLTVLLTGLVAGFIAWTVLKRSRSLPASLILGVIAAWGGGFVVALTGLPLGGTGLVRWGYDIAIASMGAIALLHALDLFRGPPRRV